MSTMRIVAGKFRGASLAAPKGLATRPTSDRVRQALFNMLEHGRRASSSRARACSTCSPAPARSALEALSRGARYALFIEEDAAARGAIRRNVEALSLTGVTKIWRRDATQARRSRHACSPSTSSSATRLMARASANKRLPRPPPGVGWRRGAIAVLEERADSEIAWPAPSRKSTGAATAIP